VAALAAVCLLAGCSGTDDDGGGNNGGGDEFEAFSEDCTITTGPGTSPGATTNNLLSAFAEASSGDVICMVNGDYSVTQGLNIGVSNIEIRGESQANTVLDFSQQTEGGNGILAQVAEGFTARQFTVENTASDAIKAKGTNGVQMIDLTVTWEGGPDTENGAYGLYPVEAKNVLVEGCTVSYASDAGVYLGQSDTAVLRNNETFGNVVGLEIENTVRATAYDNYTHDNSNGILVIDLPDLMITNGEKNIVRNNRVVNNNEPNFGKSGTAVSKMPAGTGILMVSVDQTEVFENEVHGNSSVGIGIATYLWVEPGAGSGDDYDPYPEGNWVHNNTVYDNGGDPKGAAKLLAGSGNEMPNTFWDGTYDTDKDTSDTDLRNCFKGNTDDAENGLTASVVGNNSPCEPGSGDLPAVCEMDCEHESLSPVEL
jgi:parallel beta-helix repeat protein